MHAARMGRRYLFRSAASLLTALAQLPTQPVKAEDMSDYVRNGNPGVVIVGSHVNNTTRQLECLLTMSGVDAIEVNVDLVKEDYSSLLEQMIEKIKQSYDEGKTVVIYTSRIEKIFPSQQQRLDFGVLVSEFLMDIVRSLPEDLGFLISKGGITSNDVLSKGLSLRMSRVLGQILPGCSVVRCPAYHHRYADLPVVIFPGNVGDKYSLAKAYQYLADLEHDPQNRIATDA
jgi:uncharacterized protein YgbK (DUF1537 family)